MTTYRVQQHTRDFTQIQNATIRDDRLSFRARGVLAWLLSHVDTWEASRDQIARNGTEGVSAIRTAQAELTALGYLERVEERTPSGTIYYVTNVYEVPGGTAGWLTANGSTANGSTANGKSHDKEYHLPKDDLKEDDQLFASSQAMDAVCDDEHFELFWATYKRTGPKKTARNCWNRARKKDSAEAIQIGLLRWVAYWDTPGAASIKWPQGWLSNEYWKDDPPAISRKPSASVRQKSAAELIRERTRR